MKSDNARYDCVLWGGYAFGNMGDELTLAVALQDTRRRFGDSVAILSRNVAHTQSLFPDARVLSYNPKRAPVYQRTLRRWVRHGQRSGWFRNMHVASHRLRDQSLASPVGAVPWVQAIINCQQLHLVGGGYFTDLFDVDYMLLPLHVARSASVPIHTAPLGLGPFTANAAAKLVAQALEKAGVTVRDLSSQRFCEQYGIPATLQSDDGFRLREVIPDLSLPRHDNPDPKHTRVGVCIFCQRGDTTWPQTEQWWLRFLSALKSNNEHLVAEGFCFHTNPAQDFATTQALFRLSGWDENAVSPPNADLRATIRSLSQYDVIVSSRFHAIVVAGVMGIPRVAMAAGTYYTAKMDAALQSGESVGQLVNPSTDSAKEVADSIPRLCREGRGLSTARRK